LQIGQRDRFCGISRFGRFARRHRSNPGKSWRHTSDR
jgi:hypothetical protein